jgi:hypothetical protein
MKDRDILSAIEILSAHCPWERCDIWVSREPNGVLRFTAYAAGVDEMKMPSAFGNGATPEAAVAGLKKTHPDRQLDRYRQQEITRLQMQIARLQQVSFTLPPWRPRGELGIGENPEAEPAITPEERNAPPPFITVESTTTA